MNLPPRAHITAPLVSRPGEVSQMLTNVANVLGHTTQAGTPMWNISPEASALLRGLIQSLRRDMLKAAGEIDAATAPGQHGYPPRRGAGDGE